MRSVLTALAALSLVHVARPADACSAPACIYLGTPLQGRTLPSGLTELPVGYPSWKAEPPSGDEPRLFLGDVEIDTTVRSVAAGEGWSERVLTAAEPLAPGHYRLQAPPHPCTSTSVGGQEFDVGIAAATAPASLGTLKVTRRRVPGEYPTSCDPPFMERVTQTEVELVPSPELETLLPLFRYEVTASNGPLARLPVRSFVGATRQTGNVVHTFFVVCDGTPLPKDAGDLRVAPGARIAVSVSGKVLGSDLVLPTAAVEVDAQCVDEPGQTLTSTSTTGPAASASDDGGCSQTRTSRGSSVGLGAAALFALAVLRRRSIRT